MPFRIHNHDHSYIYMALRCLSLATHCLVVIPQRAAAPAAAISRRAFGDRTRFDDQVKKRRGLVKTKIKLRILA